MFKITDVQGRGNIGGAEAVKFFGRSKLPIETLKNIWTVADQPSTSSLDLKKFAVAVRLIQLTQNGQKGKGATLETPSGVVLKPVFFEGVSGVTVQMPPAPRQGGMPPPHPTPQQPNRPMPPPQQQAYRAQTPPGSVVGSQPSSPARSPRQGMQIPPQQQYQQTPSTPSRALVGMDPYTLTPQERQRYEGIFPSYAKIEADGSKFVYGSEAVPLFMKSGVDPTSLREIWNMVDRNPVDNRLDELEFAMAMHLIVCVSKKNLPMPPGGTLPNSLLALKAASSGGAALPRNAPALGAPPQQQMPPPQVPGADGPPLLGGPNSIGGMNISDAFEGMSTMESVASQPAPAQEAPAVHAIPSYVPTSAPTPAVVPEPPTPQPQPTYVVQPESSQAAVAPTPLAPAPVATTSVQTYQVSDSHLEELNKLKSVLQKLQAENISLKAQLGNMTDEEKHVQEELGQTITEITALSTDLGLKRQEVLEAKNRLLEAKAELKSQRETKSVLTGLISEAKETTVAIESATETLRSTVETQNSVPPAPVPEAQDLFDMGYSNPVGAAPPVAENAPITTQQGLDGFANEQGMSGGVTSLPTPSPQPARELVAPGSTPQEQQQLSIPEPTGQGEYSNYAAPAPPQSGGYPAPAPMPPQQEAGGYPAAAGYSVQAPMPPQEAGGYPAAGDYSAQASMPPQQAGGYPAQAPMPPQQSGGYPAQAPIPPQHQAAAPGHVRDPSDFGEGFLMGGSAEAIPQDTSRENDNFSVAARSMASTGGYGYDDQAFEAVEDMKKKAKSADGAARDAEAAHRKLAAEADELRTDADRAEANARSLAAAPNDKSKKGRFGGSDKKKKKKVKEEADQAAKDAALIKSHFMAIQSQALEAQSVAAQTRAQADRLRDEAEAAELDMAAAASKKQRQPAPEPAPAPAAPQVYNAPSQPNYGGMGAAPQQQPYQGQAPQYGMPNGGPNGDGYNNYMQPVTGMGADAYGQQQTQAYGGPPPQQQAYGGPPPPQQQAYGGPPQMSHPDPSKMAPGAMGNGGYGGYGMPPPNEYGQMAPAPAAPANGGDPYMSPY